MGKIPIIFLFLLFASCKHGAVDSPIESPRINGFEVKSQADSLSDVDRYPLHHMVFLKLKDDVEYSDISSELNKIGDISVVHNFQIGEFKNLGDKRALSDYALIMTMSFIDSSAYSSYQKDSTHLLVVDRVKQFLAGPPITYDYNKR